MQSQPSERAAVVGKIDPALRDNTTADTDVVDMSKFAEAMFVFQCGATDITVDFKLLESDASGGTYTDISGKSITQFAATDDNKVAVINLKAEELGQGVGTAAKRYVKGRITVGDGTTGAYTAALALGMKPRFAPASDDDLAAVAQIVT